MIYLVLLRFFFRTLLTDFAGTSISSLNLSVDDPTEYASIELLVGAPGKTNVNYPPYPKQTYSGQTNYNAGAVYVFARAKQYLMTYLTSNLNVGDTTIYVESVKELFGSSLSGIIAVGQNQNVEVVNVDINTGAIYANSSILYFVSAGATVISLSLNNAISFEIPQVEKLTAQSTSCGQGGPQYDFVNSGSSHVSDYSTGAYLMLNLYPGNNQMCVSSVATLFGAQYAGGPQPFSQGDTTDVRFYVACSSNQAIAVLNSYTSGCYQNAGNNNQYSPFGYTVYIVSSTVSTSCYSGTVLYKAPLFSVNSPLPSCFEYEYVTSARIPGGKSRILASAYGQSTTQAALGYAADAGSSTLTVKSALSLFEAELWGSFVQVNSQSSFVLPESGSDTSGYYVGWSLTVDLDGNIGTTTDVQSLTVDSYSSTREITTSSPFSTLPTTNSLFVLSLWQRRRYLSTNANTAIYVNDVNFFTNVLQVSNVQTAEYTGAEIRQAVKDSQSIHLSKDSPEVDNIFLKCVIRITQGRGTGQVRYITAYDGRYRIATVSSSWTILPDSTSQYVILGKPLCVNSCGNDGFGYSISTSRMSDSSHVMAVGAPWAGSHTYCTSFNSLGNCQNWYTPLTQSGRVYLFQRLSNATRNRWILTKILEAPSISSALNTAGAASAMSINNILTSQELTASNYDHFGYSLALKDDVLYVGAPLAGTTNIGCVHVFMKDFLVIEIGSLSCGLCSGTNVTIGTISASDPLNKPRIYQNSYVGYVMTIDGESRDIVDYFITGGSGNGWGTDGSAIVTISSPFSFALISGQQYFIHTSNGQTPLKNNWGYRTTLTSNIPKADDHFGYSLSAAANFVVVGVPKYDIPFYGLKNSLTDAGGVFVFKRNNGAVEDREHPIWTIAKILTQNSDTFWESNLGSNLGISVHIDQRESTIVSGAPFIDVDSYRRNSHFVFSQVQGYLPSAGGVGVYFKSDREKQTYLAQNFDAYASYIVVEKSSDIFPSDSCGTISIGRNPAIQVNNVNFSNNTLYVLPESVIFPTSFSLSDGKRVKVIRKGSWEFGGVHIPFDAVAGGRSGESVNVADSGVLFAGAPLGEINYTIFSSDTNSDTRGGVVHRFQIYRRDVINVFDGADFENGFVSQYFDNYTIALQSSAIPVENYYQFFQITINGETRTIIYYSGVSRVITVEIPFAISIQPGMSTYIISNPVYDSTNVINDVSSPASSCTSLLQSGFSQSGYYWLQSPVSGAVFLGYCDQVTEGGGWLMCYTDDNEVDMANEYGYVARFPYGYSGYRTDCRHYPFNEVLYRLQNDEQNLQGADYAYFRAVGRKPVIASLDDWGIYPINDVYGNLTFFRVCDNPEPIPYQLLICANGLTTGFFMSGLEQTSACKSGWKSCTNWCRDKSSLYFRHAYSPRSNRNDGALVNFTGVSFNQNGFGVSPRQRMSVGIRTDGKICMAGWQGSGISCICPVVAFTSVVVAFWRFEDGLDTQQVLSLIPDVSKRLGGQYTMDTRKLGPLGTSDLVTKSLNNDLLFFYQNDPQYTFWAPQNDTFAVLCRKNNFAISFNGSQFLRTTPYAEMNSRSFRAFTWEVSVSFETVSGTQTLLSWHDSSGNYSMSFFKNEDNHIAFEVRTTNGTFLVSGRNSYGDGVWHHLAVSYDGGIAGEIRLYRLDTSGAAVTRSDCLSGVCLTGNVSGTIGVQGAGLGDGILLRSGRTAGCSQGLIISAVGGGKCKASSSTLNNKPCVNASDCGVNGQCIQGYDFSAVVTSVGPQGEILQVYITNPGRGYSSNPKLVVNSQDCTCNGATGSLVGNLDACLIAVRSTGRTERKSNFRWIREDAFPGVKLESE
eukprot:753509-Hanusia_phi.AAC.6